MDGWIKIKTKIDNTGIDKDIENLEVKAKKLRDDISTILYKSNGKADKNQIVKMESEYDAIINKITELREKKIELNATELTNDNEFDLTNYEAQIDNLAYKAAELKVKIDEAMKGKTTYSNAELKRMQADYEKIINQIENLKNKKNEIDKSSKNINNSIKSIGKGLTDTIKKVGKWALAVLGVRSAYSAIRSAINTLSQYDKQLAIDIQYIQYALAMILKPVIEWLIKAIYTILSYVNAIVRELTGVNLFKNSGISGFQKALAGSSKSAKELKKTIAGFDEMNTIDDNSNSSNANVSTPSFDLGEGIRDVKVPEWIIWIKENWEIVLAGIVAIVGAFLLLKIALNKLGIKKEATAFSSFFKSLGKATEAIAILGGIALVINQLTGFINAFTESGMSWGEMAAFLGIVLGEITLAFTLLAAATKLMDWTSIAGAVVIFAGLALVLNQVANLINAFTESGMSLNDVAILLGITFGAIIVLMGAIILLGPKLTAGLLPFSILMAEIVILLEVMSKTIPIILDACSNFMLKIAPCIIALLTTIGNIITSIIYALGTVLPPIINSVGGLFDSIFNGIANVISTLGNIIVKILETVKSLITTTLSSLLKFIKDLSPAIECFVDSAIRSVTKLINFLISGVEYLVNTLIINAVNSVIKAINRLSEFIGVSIQLVPKASIPRFVPKLAAGGIVNLPGKGVPVGGAIAGEAGREGVLPLSNPQTMQELGKTIGKYITINATINNSMNGRTISRELVKIQEQDNFAFNL